MKQSVYELPTKSFHPHYTGQKRAEPKPWALIRHETTSFLAAQDVLRRKLAKVNVLLISSKEV